MITANELRIGNFILNSNGKIEVVETLRYGLINSYDIGDEETCGEDCYNHIPLTEEWLNKFGFTGWDLGYYTLLMDRGVFFILTEDGMTIISRNVKYVHQLQNLYFALTGEELIFTP